MKYIQTLVLVLLATFSQTASAATLTYVTETQFFAVLGSSRPAWSMTEAGGGLGSPQLIVGHDGNYDSTADRTWQNNITVHFVDTYDGGLWTHSDGVLSVSMRPTSSFQIGIFGIDVSGLVGLSLNATNVSLDGESLPNLSVSSSSQFDGYAFIPKNLASFTLSYDLTPNASIVGASGQDWYSDFLVTNQGTGGVQVVPEPSVSFLVGIGLIAMMILRFKRKNNTGLSKGANP